MFLPCCIRFFFPLGGQKIDLFAHRRQKSALFDPLVKKNTSLTSLDAENQFKTFNSNKIKLTSESERIRFIKKHLKKATSY